MLNESYGIKRNTNIFESDGRAIAGGAGFGFVLEDEDDDKAGVQTDEIDDLWFEVLRWAYE
jgi:hypothetical protein